MNGALETLAQAAARLVVDDGLEYGAAKRKAARDLERRGGRRSDLPSNEAVEDEVREYLALFQADTQPAELEALRRLALAWMQRLSEFRPHLCGAVWRGTATRRSMIHIELYCDDPKSAEIGLLDRSIRFEPCRPTRRARLVARRGAVPRTGRAGVAVAARARPRRSARWPQARHPGPHLAGRRAGTAAADARRGAVTAAPTLAIGGVGLAAAAGGWRARVVARRPVRTDRECRERPLGAAIRAARRRFVGDG